MLWEGSTEIEKLNKIQSHVAVIISSVNSAVGKNNVFFGKNGPSPRGDNPVHIIFHCRISSNFWSKS